MTMWYDKLLQRHLRKAIRYLIRLNSSATSKTSPHVCIVGSGPAGFYTAQQLLKVPEYYYIVFIFCLFIGVLDISEIIFHTGIFIEIYDVTPR